MADAEVVEAGSDLVLAVLSRRSEPEPYPRVTLVQGIPKASKLEVVVQKLTEIGVDAIVPVRTERSVASAGGANRVARLRAVAREAAKQARRAWLPEIPDPITLAEVTFPGLALVFHEEAKVRLTAALVDGVGDVTLFVGPEGGFTPEEAVDLAARGAVVVSLGPQILRTETAAIVGCALVMARYGRLG